MEGDGSSDHRLTPPARQPQLGQADSRKPGISLGAPVWVEKTGAFESSSSVVVQDVYKQEAGAEAEQLEF